MKPNQLATWAARFAALAVLMLLASPAMATAVAVAIAADSAAALPSTLSLAKEPLLGTKPLHPNVLLALSVEFPTVGAAFNRLPYVAGSEYVGYFKTTSCYGYNDTQEYFYPVGSTGSDYGCGGATFSGNFMNWATLSAIDIFRYEMTGGERVIDTSTKTVLGRAFLPNGDAGQPTNFYASDANFPRRWVATYAGGNNNNIATVNPNTVTPFSVNQLSLVNCRDYVLFGDWDGNGSPNCDIPLRDARFASDPAGSGSSSGDGSQIVYNGSSYTYCAGENGYCSFSGTATVIYGANNSFATQTATGGISCSNGVFGDPLYGTAKSCYYTTPSSSGSGVATVRKYRVRVQVCDTTEGPLRATLCGVYVNGSTTAYKPIGQMQKNADHMRFSAFGYLTDQTTARYGGVMRAPMKYVGPNMYDGSFRFTGANGQAEWDASTGVFPNNPLGAAEGNSGVINYVNKFGSISGSEGAYKIYDTVGEMYYEGLRYLQGKQPTPDATAGNVTAAMKAGFPVVTNWTDPLTCSTQPQYIITIADTNAWADKTLPGNTLGGWDDTPRATEDGLDVRAWTQALGLKAKADGLLPLPGGALSSGQLDNLQDWVDGSRGNSFYIAGLAYWAKTQDIRADDSSKAISIGKQSVTSISIDVGEPSNLLPKERQLFLMGAYGSDDPKNNPNWSMASDPQRLIDAIDSAFARVSATSGAIGGGTITSGIFETGETGVFVPEFNTQGWSGELKYFTLTPTLNSSGGATGDVNFSSTPTWRASQGIPVFNETAVSDTRNIVLGNPKGDGVDFQWINLSDAQKTQLDTNPHTGVTDGNGQARLNYLRGSRAYEGIDSAVFVGELPAGADGTATGTQRPFRVRNASSLLGDIVNSSPSFVGRPSARITDALIPTASYRDWSAATERQNRTRAVYVGSNDGMLHAFNANTGAELFAYIPSVMVPKLAKLTHPGYLHEPFVDGPLVSTDAYAQGAWKTVLAGSFGAGSRGVFALDVTDPTQFNHSKVLMEFSAADDADMGYVTGRTLLVPMTIAQGNNRTSTKWFLVTSSGYNNYADGTSGDNANGYLFFISLDKAAGTAWQLGTNYYKIRIPLDSTSTTPNGLAQPGGVYNRLGVLTNLYAGDLRGNLWRADVGSSDPSSWSVAYSGAPVAVATDSNGNRQPITSAPSIAFGPGYGYLVSFGSGRMLANGDNLGRETSSNVTAFDPQSFYSIWDDLSSTISSRARLAVRTVALTDIGGTVSGASFNYGNNPADKRGWVIDLPSATNNGERVVSSPALFYGRIFFTTVIPGADPCSNGQSRSYSLNVLQGTGELFGSSAGYLASPLVLRTLLSQGKADPTGFRSDQMESSLINLGTAGQEVQRQSSVTVQSGAWSWRELPNWRELRRAPPPATP